MRAIQDRFDATGKEGLPPAYLLGFGTEEEGAPSSPTEIRTPLTTPRSSCGTFTSIAKTETYVGRMASYGR